MLTVSLHSSLPRAHACCCCHLAYTLVAGHCVLTAIHTHCTYVHNGCLYFFTPILIFVHEADLTCPWRLRPRSFTHWLTNYVHCQPFTWWRSSESLASSPSLPFILTVLHPPTQLLLTISTVHWERLSSTALKYPPHSLKLFFIQEHI